MYRRLFSSINVLSVFFTAGVCLFFLLPRIDSGFYTALVASLLWLVAAKYIIYIRPLAALLCGFMLVWFSAANYFSTLLPFELERKDIQLEGVISGLPQVHAGRTSFVFMVDQAPTHDKKKLAIKKIKLNWYGRRMSLKPGQRWRLTARLKRPRGTMNPGGFDYERWLFQQRFSATGYVRSKNPVTLLGTEGGFMNFVHNIRLDMRAMLHAKVQNDDMRSLINALLIGDRSLMKKEHWEVLRRTGTSHLLAISGLHLSLVALAMFALVRKLIYFSGIGRRKALYIASFCALLSSVAYALLAGLSLPTQRAMIMIIIGFVVLSLARNSGVFSLWSVTMLLCVLFDPFSVLSAGFWLSFAAVFWIFMLVKTSAMSHKFRQLLKIQILLAVGLAPVLAIFSLPLSFISIPTNLVILPLISFVVLPLILLSALSFSDTLFYLTEQALYYCWKIMEFFADNIIAPYFADFTLWQAVALLSAVLLMVMPRGFVLKKVSVPLFISLLLGTKHSILEENALISVLDIDQGLAVLVETANHKLLYDTGNKFPSGHTIFASTIKPVLEHKKINHLDMLMISHSDNDHSGGLDAALQSIAVDHLVGNEHGLSKKRTNNLCQAGTSWQWDGVDFAILHPEPHTIFNENNASCVLKISAGANAVLLSGDIEKMAEAKLVNDNADLQAEVLLLAHHGSKTSSTADFLDRVKPDYALISSAYKNHYSFPHPSVKKRIQVRNIKIFNTAHHGAIEVRLAPDSVKVSSYRQSYNKMWNSGY